MHWKKRNGLRKRNNRTECESIGLRGFNFERLDMKEHFECSEYCQLSFQSNTDQKPFKYTGCIGPVNLNIDVAKIHTQLRIDSIVQNIIISEFLKIYSRSKIARRSFRGFQRNCELCHKVIEERNSRSSNYVSILFSYYSQKRKQKH